MRSNYLVRSFSETKGDLQGLVLLSTSKRKFMFGIVHSSKVGLENGIHKTDIH